MVRIEKYLHLKVKCRSHLHLILDIYTVYLTRGISLTGDYDFGEDYPIRVTEFVPLLEYV